jgi:hypothetical protein
MMCCQPLLDVQATLESGGIKFIGSPTDRPGIRFPRRQGLPNEKSGACARDAGKRQRPT